MGMQLACDVGSKSYQRIRDGLSSKQIPTCAMRQGEQLATTCEGVSLPACLTDLCPFLFHPDCSPSLLLRPLPLPLLPVMKQERGQEGGEGRVLGLHALGVVAAVSERVRACVRAKST